VLVIRHYVLPHTTTASVYPHSLHDAHPITPRTQAIYTESIPNPRNDIVDLRRVAEVAARYGLPVVVDNTVGTPALIHNVVARIRSEEHTSELQSRENLVCRPLLDKKKI